jgi:hypothetical protein
MITLLRSARLLEVERRFAKGTITSACAPRGSGASVECGGGCRQWSEVGGLRGGRAEGDPGAAAQIHGDLGGPAGRRFATGGTRGVRGSGAASAWPRARASRRFRNPHQGRRLPREQHGRVRGAGLVCTAASRAVRGGEDVGGAWEAAIRRNWSQRGGLVGTVLERGSG